MYLHTHRRYYSFVLNGMNRYGKCARHALFKVITVIAFSVWPGLENRHVITCFGYDGLIWNQLYGFVMNLHCVLICLKQQFLHYKGSTFKLPNKWQIIRTVEWADGHGSLNHCVLLKCSTMLRSATSHLAGILCVVSLMLYYKNDCFISAGIVF